MIGDKHKGFTAVELMITLVVGGLVTIAAAQLYQVVRTDSTEIRDRSNASNIAHTQARTTAAGRGERTVCAPVGAQNVALPTEPKLPPLASAPASMSVKIECANTYIHKVIVTVTYDSPQKQVVHAVWKY